MAEKGNLYHPLGQKVRSQETCTEIHPHLHLPLTTTNADGTSSTAQRTETDIQESPDCSKHEENSYTDAGPTGQVWGALETPHTGLNRKYYSDVN